MAANTDDSFDLKNLIVVLLIIFLYPVGVLLMWFMTNWPVWVKILVTAPIILAVVGILLYAALFSYARPKNLFNQSNYSSNSTLYQP